MPAPVTSSQLPSVIVHNLVTGETAEYTISPRLAVMAAYAQTRGDFSTWEYERKYGKRVQSIERGDHVTWTLGDWSVVEKR